MKQVLLKILLIFSLIGNNLYADDVTPLEKGTPAPYTGLLFTLNKAEQMRKELIDKDTYKLLNQSLEKSLELERKNIDLSQLKINNLSEQNNTLAKELYSARETSNWEKFFFFALGVIGTGFAFYGVKAATK